MFISIIPIIIFVSTTLFFLLTYYKTLKYLRKHIIRQPAPKELDSETLERLKNKLIDDEGIKNIEEMIYRMQKLRSEAEEILRDSQES